MIAEMNIPSYGKAISVKPKQDDGVYKKGEDYFVFLDRMTCGKYQMYWRDGFQSGSGQSHRCFETSDDLHAKFETNA